MTGIMLCSSQDVTVQTVTGGTRTSDVYSIIPPSNLGVDHIITNYYLLNTPYTPGQPFGLSVTAISDQTQITVTVNSPLTVIVTYNGVNYTNGDKIYETLNKYQTTQVSLQSMPCQELFRYAYNCDREGMGNCEYHCH